MTGTGDGGRRALAGALTCVVLLVVACSTGPGASDRAAEVITSSHPAPPGWAAAAEELHGSDGSYGRVRTVNEVPVLYVGTSDGFDENLVELRYVHALPGADADRVCQEAASWLVAVDADFSVGYSHVGTVAGSCVAALARRLERAVIATGAGDDAHHTRQLTWSLGTDFSDDRTPQLVLGLTYDSSR